MGVSFNTVAMDHINELIEACSARSGLTLPKLKSGLGAQGRLGFSILGLVSLGLELEGISAKAGVPVREAFWGFSASAVGLLGVASLELGPLEIYGGRGWYLAGYSESLPGRQPVRAGGLGGGFKLGVRGKLIRLGGLSLSVNLGLRRLSVPKLVDPRGNPLGACCDRPYLDFSGVELGMGIRLRWGF